MPHRQPCPSSKIPTAKKIKRMIAVSPLTPRCWHLPSTGGSANFTLARPPHPPSAAAPAPSPETRGSKRRRRTPCPCRLLIFTLDCWRQLCLRLSPTLERQLLLAGSHSELPPTCTGCRLLHHQRWHWLRLRIQRGGEEEGGRLVCTGC